MLVWQYHIDAMWVQQHNSVWTQVVELEQGWQSVLRERTSKSRTISREKNNMPPTFESASHKVKNHQHTCIENYWDGLPAQLFQSLEEKVCCEEDHPCCIAIVKDIYCSTMALPLMWTGKNLLSLDTTQLCRGLSKVSYIQWCVTFWWIKLIRQHYYVLINARTIKIQMSLLLQILLLSNSKMLLKFLILASFPVPFQFCKLNKSGGAWGQSKLLFDTINNDRSTIHNHSAWSVS